MILSELAQRSIVILGLGQEGVKTYEFLRQQFPQKILGLADRLSITQLTTEVQQTIQSDKNVRLHLGKDYLTSLTAYDVIVRSPGIPLNTPTLQRVIKMGKMVTSHTSLFFAQCPATIIGITGTKGKSTTASLIQAILLAGGLNSRLVGNIGNPPLTLLQQANASNFFVYELSSYQLEGLKQSPHIAVLLNIVPEHLDYHGSFDQYVEAKRNITRYQTDKDYLVYNAMFLIPRQVADETKARRFGFSLDRPSYPGCFVAANDIVYCSERRELEVILKTCDVPLLGTVNLQNVLAAVAVGRLLDILPEFVARAVRDFRPLEYRLERIGTYHGVTFYDDSLATIPEATMAAMDALGQNVQTIILGGYDRHLDFSHLAHRLVNSQVKTVILFPESGHRIWKVVCDQQTIGRTLPKSFFVNSIADAVLLAYQNTEPGKICLHSPASPSFGLFKDYKERGDLFKRYVSQLGESDVPGRYLTTSFHGYPQR